MLKRIQVEVVVVEEKKKSHVQLVKILTCSSRQRIGCCCRCRNSKHIHINTSPNNITQIFKILLIRTIIT